MASKSHIAVALVSEHKLDQVSVPTKSPGLEEVLVKVQLATYGAADGHAVDDGFYVSGYPQIVGLVAIGKVLEVGEGVNHIKTGDLVGAYTMPGADRATQEYVIAPACRVTKISEVGGTTPAEIATIIDNFVTAWWTIMDSFKLPTPLTWPPKDVLDPTIASTPILVWGAGTASAQYIIQVLKLLGFTNIIATASPRSSARALSLGATHVADYNDPKVVDQIKSVVGSSTPIKFAVDTVSTEQSMRLISQLVTAPDSRVALLMPIKVGEASGGHINQGGAVQLFATLPQEHNPFKEGVLPLPTYTFTWDTNPLLKDCLMVSILPALLQAGLIKPLPVRLINTGSLVDRVREAAALLKNNKLNGAKAVIDFNA
ncbi:hypothetical protein FRB94_013615 [Tulasnella sp. JGI-2019a]|nr:hypothetical protein FRB94_013615 [Tulasnella sp. JGI-2019a]KAG9023751.1 hypothetical protein FRB95_012555 [Tulasnella sp. JGI-2019a]